MTSAIQAEEETQAEQKVELKYCEGCGALTLRPAASAQIYCPGCARKLAEVARPDEAGRRS
jgi:uncharacterized paraquat-inducible protein A